MAEASTRLHAALSKRDLPAILNELADVAPKWVLIGTCLGVQESEIEEIEQQHLPAKLALRKVILRWLDATDHVVTWANIVAALRENTLNEKRLAQQIEDDVNNRSIRKSISSPSEAEQDSPTRSKSLPGPEFASPSNVQSGTTSVDSLLESNPTQNASLTVAVSQSMQLQVEIPAVQKDSILPTPLSTTSMQKHSVDTSGVSRQESDTSNIPSNEKERAKLPFSCGCGECPPLDFFSNPLSCPNPLPTVSKFPYLDTSGLTEQEREDLEIQLNEDYLSINQEYASFAISLRRSLKEQNVSAVELADCLMELRGHEPLSNSSKEKGVCLLENRYSEMKEAENITRVFEILSDYSSFFNYDIIAFIAKHLGSKSDKENLAKYEAALETYCKHHVFECPSYSCKNSKFPDLILKVDPEVTESDKFTLKSLRRFTVKVARALKVTKHSLLLCSIKKGCLEITFQIPPHIKEAVVPLSNDQNEALWHLGIQKVMFGNAQSSYQQRAQPQQTHQLEVQGTKLLERVVTSTKERSSEWRPRPPGSHSRERESERGECLNFKLLGSCKSGNRCRYHHVEPMSE